MWVPACSPQLGSCSLALLPAPITTASYSRCSWAAAPAWASRSPDRPGGRCQPCSQWEEQTRLSLPRSTAAIAPQRLTASAPRPAAWTLLSRRNFSQGFRAQGGAGGARAGNALGRRGGCSGQGPRRALPLWCCPSGALTLAQFCWGFVAGPETSRRAEERTDPAWGSARCQELPSLYSRKVLGRQAGA